MTGTPDDKIVFVAGCSGFLGSHLSVELAGRGMGIRCATRHKGHVLPGIEHFEADITRAGTLGGTLEGVNTIVNLVGIIRQQGGQTFERVHVRGTENLLASALEAGVEHFIYISALGALLTSPHPYQSTKARAEEAVRASGIGYTIFRPSLIIGPGGGFVGSLKGVVSAPGPFVPVPGDGQTRFQPIYAGDLARCIASVVKNPSAAHGRTFEVGGPEQLSYDQMVMGMAGALGVTKRPLHIPMGLMMLGAWLTGWSPRGPVTAGQLRMLAEDNVCDTGGVSREFGFEPISYRAALQKSI